MSLIEDLLDELRKAQAQLPDTMKHCTILFKECEKGHGRLTAKNWIDHGCEYCALEKARAERDSAHALLREIDEMLEGEDWGPRSELRLQIAAELEPKIVAKTTSHKYTRTKW